MNPQDTHSYTAQPARKEVEFSHRNVQMEVAITETLSVLGGTITRVKERLTITHMHAFELFTGTQIVQWHYGTDTERRWGAERNSRCKFRE